MNPSSDLARHGYQILEKLSPAPGTARFLTLKITKPEVPLRVKVLYENRTPNGVRGPGLPPANSKRNPHLEAREVRGLPG